VRRFLTLVRANAKMVLRNRQALFWSLAFPLVFMFLLGVVFGDQGSVASAKVGVADIDGTRYSRALTQALSASGRLEIVTGGEAVLTQRLKKGDLSALVVIPQGFGAGVGAAAGAVGANGTGSSAGSTSTTTAPQPATIKVYFDPSSLVGSQVAMGTVSAVVEGFQQQLTRAPELIRIQSASVQRSDLSYRDFLIPGVLALALLTSGVIGIATTVVEYRQEGILRRVQVTPLPVSQFMGGRVITQVGISLMQALVLLGVGRLAFGVSIVGSYLVLIGLLIVGTLCFVTIGFFIASFTKNVEATAAVANVVTVPMMFLGGVFFPIDNAPTWIQPVVRVIPVAYLANGLRDVMIRGYGFGAVWPDFAFLAGMAAVFGLLSIRVFRWQE
jgi:ABC-2 type transport system permease protein